MGTSSVLFNRGKELAMEAMRERDAKKKKPTKTVTHVKIDKDDPVDGLVRVAAGVVGMFSEASKYRKAKKQALAEGRGEPTDEPQENGTVAAAQLPDSSPTHQTPDASRRHDLATTEEINEAIWRRDDSHDDSTRNGTTSQDSRAHSTEPNGTDRRDFGPETNGEPAEEGEEEEKGWSARRRRKKLEKDLAVQFVKRHPFNEQSMTPSESTQIDLPVVIPQRRPEKRSRGFVRAYSPVLADANIDEKTFLDFVDTFNKAIEPNPYLYAMNLAGTVGLMLPDPFTILVGMATMAATEATIAMNSRFNSARFLDRLNAEFFMPRGLVCMVATWKPDAAGDDPVGAVSGFDGRPVSQSAEADSPTTAKQDLAKKWKEMEEYMKTDNLINKFTEQVKPSGPDFEWPEPAPLVFPSAEATAARERTKADGKRKNAIDRGEVWLDEYMDRRAQARYIKENPAFTVAHSLPKPEFTSRYADPFHPAASGDIVAFLTAGKYSTKGKIVPEQAPGQQQQDPAAVDEDGYPLHQRNTSQANNGTQSYLEARGWQQSEHRYGYGYDTNPSTGQTDYRDSPDYQRELNRRSTTTSATDVYKPELPPAKEEREEKDKEKKSGLSRLFQSDLLYLIIVNLPSEEEMAQFAPEGVLQTREEGERREGDVVA